MNLNKISRRNFLSLHDALPIWCRCGPDRLRLLRFQHCIFRGRLCRCFF